MKHPIVFSNVDETSTGAVVVEWLVEVGDHVEVGANVVEVDVEKVVIEIPSPVAGVLVEINYAIEDDVPPGSVLGYIEDGS